MDAQERKERQDAEMIVHRKSSGRYIVHFLYECSPGYWRVWRGINNRWYGENYDQPNVMIDAATFSAAKYDIRMGYVVKHHGAGNDCFPDGQP